EDALGHRLESDDRGVAIGEEGDQLVFVETMVAVVELRRRIDVQHLLPHGGVTVDMGGNNSKLSKGAHIDLVLSGLPGLGLHPNALQYDRTRRATPGRTAS